MRRSFSFLLLSVSLIFLPMEAQSSEARGFGPFFLQTAKRSYGYSRVKFEDGKAAERFELRAGDCPKSTGDCNADRERIEFAEMAPGEKKGVDHWYGWSIYLPEDFPRTDPVNTKLGQFHQKGNSGPELLFQLFDSGYGIKMTDPGRWDNDPMNPLPDFRDVIIWPRSEMIGRWTRVILNARWSTKGDGYFHIWVNGKPGFSYTGPTTNDAKGMIYFKYGIYRSFVSEYGKRRAPSLVAFYRNVKRGKNRAEVE